jgi:F0F1-type ATP synthase epsilon subunit
MGAEIKLTSDEASALKNALSGFVIRTRTGELGILHGMDRFVSTHRCLGKAERNVLDQACRKIGMSRGLAETGK